MKKKCQKPQNANKQNWITEQINRTAILSAAALQMFRKLARNSLIIYDPHTLYIPPVASSLYTASEYQPGWSSLNTAQLHDAFLCNVSP